MKVRRFSWIVVLACAACGLAASSADAAARSNPSIPHVPAKVRREISATLNPFVFHAVRRHDVTAAYDLVTPTLRDGMTRRSWASGDIPVYPFPAQARRSYGWWADVVGRNEVWVELYLQPRRGAKVGPILFNVQFTRTHGKWLVNSFIPAATFAPLNGSRTKVRSVRDFSPQAQGEGSSPGRSRVSHLYALVPVVLIGALLAGLLAWGLAARLRDNRLRALSIRADVARARPRNGP